MTRRRSQLLLSAFCALALGIPDGVRAAPITLAASGALPADIQAQVDAFRALLGEPNNGNAAGPLTGGRREINWDGGGSLDTSVAGTPFTGFQNIRGATFTTPGTGFVQAPTDGLATQFANPTYADQFAPFSPARLFAPIGSNVTDVTFSVPGTDGAVPASVSAFGAIFSDVSANTTTIAFFTEGDEPLGAPFAVPAIAGVGDATFSFLGVAFDAGERITRVRITTGDAAFGPDDVPGELDLVAMDDFLYAEPIPEPGTLALLSLGLAGFGARRLRATR